MDHFDFESNNNKKIDKPVFVLSAKTGKLWISEDASMSDLRKTIFLLNKYYQDNWVNKKNRYDDEYPQF
jgi:hypothetical protein